jgi:membrane-bound ClpP family serine protease
MGDESMCHVLFAVPLVSLLFFGMLPPVEAAALYALVNVPVLLLGGHIWKVHRRPPLTGREGMIGQRAVAETALRPRGLVRCKGELWTACAPAPVEAGGRLRVVAVRNMELLVGAVEDGAPEAERAAAHRAAMPFPWCHYGPGRGLR